MNINNQLNYIKNRMLGFQRRKAGIDRQGKQLYKWVKQTTNPNMESLQIKTKLPSGTMVCSEYQITPMLNVGKLIRKEIMKSDGTQILGFGYSTGASIKKGNEIKTIFLNRGVKENTFSRLLNYVEQNKEKAIVNLKNFAELLKLK